MGTYSYRNDLSISMAFLTSTKSFPALTALPDRFSPKIFVINTIPDSRRIPYTDPPIRARQRT